MGSFQPALELFRPSAPHTPPDLTEHRPELLTTNFRNRPAFGLTPISCGARRATMHSQRQRGRVASKGGVHRESRILRVSLTCDNAAMKWGVLLPVLLLPLLLLLLASCQINDKRLYALKLKASCTAASQAWARGSEICLHVRVFRNTRPCAKHTPAYNVFCRVASNLNAFKILRTQSQSVSTRTPTGLDI